MAVAVDLEGAAGIWICSIRRYRGKRHGAMDSPHTHTHFPSLVRAHDASQANFCGWTLQESLHVLPVHPCVIALRETDNWRTDKVKVDGFVVCVCWTLDGHPFWFRVLWKEFDTHRPRISCTAVLVKRVCCSCWFTYHTMVRRGGVCHRVRRGQTMNEGKDKRVLASLHWRRLGAGGRMLVMRCGEAGNGMDWYGLLGL